jgi:single-strand DNA-binding protein
MANMIQRLEYEGYLASDPEMRFTPTGKQVTNFRIGSSRQYKNANGEVVKETTWLKITAWAKLAEIINQYCAKGSHVIVYGFLRAGENGSPAVYELKSGGYGASYEITATEIRILKGKEQSAENSADHTEDYTDSDELPF